ncbi:glycosyltransferase [Uliginosibacterium sp. H3]|uniref:Glycosyltransferase n=1 Tax=Uliginosibacterium silvisoli TaxID=3114758 RepID=A0ABU6K228_9RHOO|nr:glycosyltransferase [Uliginosibacterium sp. H3]
MSPAPIHHVLLAIDSLTGRGAEKVVVNLGEALLQLGHRVSIVIYEDIVEFEVDPRIRIHRLNPVARGKVRLLSRLTDNANVRQFKALLATIEAEQGRVDLILSALPRIDRILSRIRDKRIHHVIHNALSLQNGIRKNGWRKKLARIWHAKRMYDGRQIIGVSAGVGEDLKTWVKVRPASLRTIYNPFHFEHLLGLAAEPFTPPAGVQADEYLLHIGAFTLKQKRQDVLIEAFAASGLQCKLVLLGKGKDEAKIRDIIKRCGVEDRVILAGFQANPYPWIRNARLLVLSSDYEGFGNVLVEAMVVGTPVLSTDCPAGPGEILAGAMSGSLVPPGDVQALAQKMKAFHAQPPQIDVQSLNRFAAATVANEYLKLIS